NKFLRWSYRSSLRLSHEKPYHLVELRLLVICCSWSFYLRFNLNILLTSPKRVLGHKKSPNGLTYQTLLTYFTNYVLIFHLVESFLFLSGDKGTKYSQICNPIFF